MTKELAYADRFTDLLVSTISSDTSEDSVLNDLAIGSGDKIWLALEVDKQSWVDLFSATMTGADLMYKDNAHQVLWILWKAAKMGTFCQQVADCITSNAATQGALEQWLSDSGLSGGAGNPEERLSDEVLGQDWLAGLDCDNDKLWGACQEVVDGVFDSTLEILQRLDLISNNTELMGELLDSIPIVGGLLSFAFDFTTWMLDTAKALFLAADSPDIRDELCCDLFCLAQASCELTMANVQTTFKTNAISQPPPAMSSLAENLQWLMELTLTGDTDLKIASTVCLMGVMVMEFGGSFGQMALGVKSMQQLAAIGVIEEASSGWTVTCDECPDAWCVEYTVADDLNSWIPFAGRAVFDGGWKRGNEPTIIQINSPVWGQDISISEVTITMNEEFAPSYGYQYWPEGTVGSPNQQNSGGDGISHTFVWSSTTDRIAVGIDGSTTVNAKIISIQIKGNGTPPKTPNC